jgi:ligand-binding sensor domain-containing protein
MLLFGAMAALTGRKVFSRSSRGVVGGWGFFITVAIACAFYSKLATAEPVPVWAVFTQDNSDLPSNGVEALAFGADGSLWAGTEGGLVRFDKDGHWQSYSTLGGLPSNRVLALALGGDGSVWAGTFGGLARLDKDGRWQSYSKASTQGGLPSDSVQALALGADGSLWAGTFGGLARLDKDGHWQTYSWG